MTIRLFEEKMLPSRQCRRSDLLIKYALDDVLILKIRSAVRYTRSFEFRRNKYGYRMDVGRVVDHQPYLCEIVLRLQIGLSSDNRGFSIPVSILLNAPVVEMHLE